MVVLTTYEHVPLLTLPLESSPQSPSGNSPCPSSLMMLSLEALIRRTTSSALLEDSDPQFTSQTELVPPMVLTCASLPTEFTFNSKPLTPFCHFVSHEPFAATVLDQLDKLGILGDAKCVASVAKVIVDTKLGDGFIAAHLGTDALARVGRAGDLTSSQPIIGLALSVGGVAHIGANARNTEAEIHALPLEALLVQRARNSIADINVLAHTSLRVASLGKWAGNAGTKVRLVIVGDKVPLAVGRSIAVSILEDLPEGVDDARTIAETNNHVISRSLVVLVIEFVSIVIPSAAAAKTTLSATVLVPNLELGKMVVTASIGGTDEPVTSVVEDNVEIGNVALLLADTQLLGTLEGLVHGHDRSILLE